MHIQAGAIAVILQKRDLTPAKMEERLKNL